MSERPQSDMRVMVVTKPQSIVTRLHNQIPSSGANDQMAQLDQAVSPTVQKLIDHRSPEQAAEISRRRSLLASSSAAAAVRLAAGDVIRSDAAKQAAEAMPSDDDEKARDRRAVYTLRTWLRQMSTSARIVRHCTEAIADCADLAEMARAAAMQTEAMKAAMECWFSGWTHLAEELDRLNSRLSEKDQTVEPNVETFDVSC